MDIAQKQHIKMTQTPIGKLITSLAIPTIISMLITSVYNMADTYFVSQLGTSATGAVGVVFPLMAIIQAIGFTLGVGSGSFISRLLGKQDYQKADSIASTALLMAILFGLSLTFFGLTNLDPLMNLLGATETILPYARQYASIILYAAAISASSFVLNNQVRAEGKASLSMIGITTGGILNIILDPIFIFGFQLGIAGAAWATIVSQTISCSILLTMIFSKHSQLHLHPAKVSRDPLDYIRIIQIGFPSLCRQGLASIATISLNTSARIYGDAAVAAMSVNGRVFMLLFSVILGFGQGYQPVVGFNYGAKRYDRVRSAFWFAIITELVIAATMSSFGFLFAPKIMGAFAKNDPLMVEIGIRAMHYQCIALLFQPIGTIANMTFQSIGKPLPATLISCGRQGIFFFPLIYLLPQIIGLQGIQMTQPLADLCTATFAIPFLFYFFSFLRKKETAGATL
ncbi:MAG: MATE family efflux transporter [Erysipelotrichaceae bacterium]|nr:MATE family efflux transporter [Erysipelotrichaceae bacterium]